MTRLSTPRRWNRASWTREPVSCLYELNRYRNRRRVSHRDRCAPGTRRDSNSAAGDRDDSRGRTQSPAAIPARPDTAKPISVSLIPSGSEGPGRCQCERRRSARIRASDAALGPSLAIERVRRRGRRDRPPFAVNPPSDTAPALTLASLIGGHAQIVHGATRSVIAGLGHDSTGRFDFFMGERSAARNLPTKDNPKRKGPPSVRTYPPQQKKAQPSGGLS